jgi:FtsH-binding integral membrane protein
LEGNEVNETQNTDYKNANRLYWIFTGMQITCLLVLVSPIILAIITKAYIGDLFAAVYQYFGAVITVFLASSALALFFRYRSRILRNQNGSH